MHILTHIQTSSHTLTHTHTHTSTLTHIHTPSHPLTPTHTHTCAHTGYWRVARWVQSNRDLYDYNKETKDKTFFLFLNHAHRMRGGLQCAPMSAHVRVTHGACAPGPDMRAQGAGSRQDVCNFKATYPNEKIKFSIPKQLPTFDSTYIYCSRLH